MRIILEQLYVWAKFLRRRVSLNLENILNSQMCLSLDSGADRVRDVTMSNIDSIHRWGAFVADVADALTA